MCGPDESQYYVDDVICDHDTHPTGELDKGHRVTKCTKCGKEFIVISAADNIEENDASSD
jgi:hypothetical protein